MKNLFLASGWSFLPLWGAFGQTSLDLFACPAGFHLLLGRWRFGEQIDGQINGIAAKEHRIASSLAEPRFGREICSR